MRKLNNRGKVAVSILGALFILGVVAIVDKIRFEITESNSEDVYQLKINDEVIKPSRVISKSNFVFNHYKDREVEVKIPKDSTINFGKKFTLKNIAGENIAGDITYLSDGKYDLVVKEKGYTYEYKLVVDNDFFVEVDKTHARQGGYLVTTFYDLNEDEEVSVDATFKTNSKILNQDTNVPIPIDYDSEVGANLVTFKSNKSSYDYNVDIGETPKNERFIVFEGYEKKEEPESELYKEFKKASTLMTKEKLYSSFIQPTEGVVSSGFGDSLYINNDNEPTVINYGIDYVNIEGTPVKSTSNGKVAFVGELEVYGKVVIIDHGYGITSSYYHLSETLVNEGDVVSFETEIGKMGSTGNVSGSNLNFQIQLNGIMVDPNIFFVGNLIF